MQQVRLQEHVKDPRSVALGKVGGQIRMAQLNPQERSALAKHAAHARWHPLQAKAQRERAEEIARMVKQVIDDYLPSNKRDMMEPGIQTNLQTRHGGQVELWAEPQRASEW